MLCRVVLSASVVFLYHFHEQIELDNSHCFVVSQENFYQPTVERELTSWCLCYEDWITPCRRRRAFRLNTLQSDQLDKSKLIHPVAEVELWLNFSVAFLLPITPFGNLTATRHSEEQDLTNCPVMLITREPPLAHNQPQSTHTRKKQQVQVIRPVPFIHFNAFYKMKTETDMLSQRPCWLEIQTSGTERNSARNLSLKLGWSTENLLL